MNSQPKLTRHVVEQNPVLRRIHPLHSVNATRSLFFALVCLFLAVSGQAAEGDLLLLIYGHSHVACGASASSRGRTVNDPGYEVDFVTTDTIPSSGGGGAAASTGTASASSSAAANGSENRGSGFHSFVASTTATSSASGGDEQTDGAGAIGNATWEIVFVPQVDLLATVTRNTSGGGLAHAPGLDGDGTVEVELKAGHPVSIGVEAASSSSYASGTSGRSHSANLTITMVPILRPKLMGIEVTQSIQDLYNSVPLVTGKRTFARAYLEAGSWGDLGKMVTGRLHGRRNGTPLPGSPLAARLSIPLGNDVLKARSHLEGAFVGALTFELPKSWCADSVCLEFDGDGEIFESHEPAESGGVAGDGIVCVSFQPTARPKVIGVPIGLRGPSGITATAPSSQEVARLISYARNIFPAEDFDWEVAAPLYQWSSGGSLDSDDLLNEVSMFRFMDERRGPEDQVFHLGVVRAGSLAPGSTLAGLANGIPDQVAWAATDSDTTFAHELGHLLGCSHTVHSFYDVLDGFENGGCGELAAPFTEDFPFYDLTRVSEPTFGRPLITPITNDLNAEIFGFSRHYGNYLIRAPAGSVELMSYCLPREARWISSYNYSNVRTRIRTVYPFPAFAPAALAGAPPVAQDYLLVRGIFSFENQTVEWRPFQCRPASAALPVPAPGESELRLLDGTGVPLATVPVEIKPAVDNETGLRAGFIAAIPFHAEARRVELWRNGVFVAARDASLNVPTVRVLSPAPGISINTPEFDIRWAAEDADGDPLSFVVQFSADNGSTWRTVALDLPVTNLTVRCDDVPGSAQALVRVLASDGFYCALDVSDGPFTVPDKGPMVFVEDPLDGSEYFAEQGVALAALALDREDGRVDGAGLEWFSDRDGLLGTGESLQRSAASLSVGEHQLHLVARDSQGHTSAVTNRVTIHPFIQPGVRVLGLATNHLLRLELFGTSNTLAVMEVSSNLVHWTVERTMVQSNRYLKIWEPMPTNADLRFYRVRTEPLVASIEVQPVSKAGFTGQPVTLSVGASGSLRTYQWFFNGSAIAGATSATFSITNAQPVQSGTYSVVVSNFTGAVTSAPVLVTIMGANYEVIHHFGTNSLDGVNGWGALIRASDGLLYGCARGGAISNSGVAFRMRLDGGDYTVLRRFDPATDGGTPLGGMIECSDGLLYGTCNLGGTNSSGTIWRMNRDGSGFTVLRHLLSSGDCRNPSAQLLEASDGMLYGTAYAGGGFGRGGVFRLNKDGSSYQIISGFNFAGGSAPRAPLGGVIEATNGFLYGATELGGSTNRGAIYRLSPDGADQALIASLGVFAGGAANPEGTLLQASDGLLYGTTYSGGASNKGSIFRIGTDGNSFSILQSLGNLVDGPTEPRVGLIQLPGDILAGTTRFGGFSNQGTIFTISTNGSEVTTRHAFTGSDGDGGRSRSPLLFTPGGVVYGMTFGGGTNDQGVVFRQRFP